MAADMTPAVDSVSGPTKLTDRVERGAGGVVFDRLGRVLLLHHADGSWVFPKGHVERGESELDAAIREVEEEAGVRAWCPDAEPTWTTRYVNPRGRRREITWFAMRSDDAAAVSEELFTEAGFFPPAAAAQKLTHDEDKRLLAAVVEAGHGGPR